MIRTMARVTDVHILEGASEEQSMRSLKDARKSLRVILLDASGVRGTVFPLSHSRHCHTLAGICITSLMSS